MLHEAHLVHQTPYRFRVRIPAAKGNQRRLQFLQEQLAHCPSVSSAHGNPVTGTLLVSHSGDLEAVIAFAEEKGLFTLVEKSLVTVARVTVAAYQRVDQEIKRVSDGKLDLPHAAFVAFLATGVYQMARGRLVAPTWHGAFWYAFNIFVKAQAHKGAVRAASSEKFS